MDCAYSRNQNAQDYEIVVVHQQVMVESPSLDVFKGRLDEMLGDMV